VRGGGGGGGVGATADARAQVGLLDIDICGPSVPKLVGLEGEEIHRSNAGWSPVYVEDNLAVMSIGFLLPNPDDAVIWRGPRKNGLIKQFLKARAAGGAAGGCAGRSRGGRRLAPCSCGCVAGTPTVRPSGLPLP